MFDDAGVWANLADNGTSGLAIFEVDGSSNLLGKTIGLDIPEEVLGSEVGILLLRL